MGAICRIYEKSNGGMKFVAEIRGDRVTGPKAGSIQRQLRRYGFPHAPLATVIDQLLMNNPNMGAAYAPGWPRQRKDG
jgi:hypothetical protein